MSWPAAGQFWDKYEAQLTPTGSLQHVELGRKVRKRYDALFADLDPKQINDVVRSYTSNKQRTLFSAWSFLNGMFPSTPRHFMYLGDRQHLDMAAIEAELEKTEYGGKYVSITPGHPNFIDEAEYQKYVDAHIMFKDMSVDKYLLSAGIAQHWPHGRGCYVSEDKGFIIWVGEEDHLRIMCMEKGTILNKVFDRLKGAIDVVNSIEGMDFAQSADYGVVTSCPTNLGTAMRASLHIALPNLTSDGSDAKAKAVAKPLGLSVRGLDGEHTPIGVDGTVDISPSARFCIKEAEIITALYKGIELLSLAEVDAANAAAWKRY